MPNVIPTVSPNYRPVWMLVAGILMAALLFLVMSAQARDTRAPQSDDNAIAAMAPGGRTASELQWNAQEDLRAGANVGLPGIY